MLWAMSTLVKTPTNFYWRTTARAHLLEVKEEAAGHCNKMVVVPAGKLWKILFASMTWVASGDAGNRNIRYAIYDRLGQKIFEMVPAANQIANATERYTMVGDDGPTEVVAGSHILPIFAPEPVLLPSMAMRWFDNGAVQDGTQSQATLTIAEPVTAGDTITINGTAFTLVAALTGAENEILIGANEAATKVNLNAALGATPTLPSTLHTVHPETRRALEVTAADFAGDGMVFTAVDAGSAGDAITCTQTLTHASNIWDADTFGTTTGGVNSADTGDLHLLVAEYAVDGHGF